MTYDMFRSPQTIKAYHRHHANLPKNVACEFCTFQNGHPQIIKDYGDLLVVRNKFPYKMWDNYFVNDQIMLIPKRHITSIAEFDSSEDQQFLTAVKDYESRDYCTYSRVPSAKSKSIAHLHIHFIKLSDKHVDTVLYHKNIGHKFLK